MKRFRLPFFALVGIGAIAACDRGASDQNIMIDNNSAASANVEMLPPDESTAANTGGPALNESADSGSEQASPPAVPGAATIPSQYRGRWGMNAADCDPSRSDNKGLITIGERSIRFYESTAKLKEQRPAIATSFAGLFAFTGEGQSWEKVVTLTRTGDSLKRADDEGSYSYTRCR
jgi:hypothetical protein